MKVLIDSNVLIEFEKGTKTELLLSLLGKDCMTLYFIKNQPNLCYQYSEIAHR